MSELQSPGLQEEVGVCPRSPAMPSGQQQGCSPSVATCRDEGPGLRTVASSLLLEHVPMCLGVERRGSPAVRINRDSMCYFWQLFHKIFFFALKFKIPGRQLRGRLQDVKTCNSEQYTTV